MQNQNNEEKIEEQEVNLIDYFHIALRYKWLVLFIFIGVFTLVNIYTIRLPKIYRASARILLEDKKPETMFYTTFTNSKTFLNNNMEILTSYPLLGIANQILQKNQNYKYFPISETANPSGYLKSRMTVASQRDTDILTISVESTHSLEAMAAANAIANALMQANTNHARVEFKNTREFLAKQLDEAERRLRDSEEELRNYKIENGISELTEETKALIEKSSDLEATLSDAQTELDVATKHLNFLKSELSIQDSLLLDVNTIITSPLLEQLRNEIVTNQTQYVSLLTKSGYSPNHPELKELENSIENAKKRLKTEISRIISVKVGASVAVGSTANFQ